MNSLLVVIASALGASARGGIDAALAALAYEHPVSILLVGDGVSLLAKDQQPEQHGLADLARGLAALLHHGALEIGVSAPCLQQRGITATAVAARLLDPEALSAWISEFRHVHRF